MTDKAVMFPVLRYEDAGAAIDWLIKAFGFQAGMNVPDANGGVAHAELNLGGAGIMLGSLAKEAGDNAWSAVRQGLYVYVDDVDAHYAAARAAGADIFIDIRDTDYGSREYCARDPEGNLWSFGSYRPQP